jgi:hypothetical protein
MIFIPGEKYESTEEHHHGEVIGKTSKEDAPLP